MIAAIALLSAAAEASQDDLVAKTSMTLWSVTVQILATQAELWFAVQNIKLNNRPVYLHPI